MQVIPRWVNLLNLRNSVAFSATQAVSFHSTPVCNNRSNKKWNYDFVRSQQKPSKDHIRYVTHEKRADTKKALRNLLYNSGAFEGAFQHDRQPKKKMDKKCSWDAELGYDSDSCTKKGRLKSRRAEKAKSKQKRKLRRGYVSEDDERHQTIFQATFGNRWCSWTFNSFDSSSFQSSTSRFEWRENTYTKNYRHKKWEAASDIESDDELEEVGSYSDRMILGLPQSGPLKMEDVKNAFHLSAHKWHPDKHQGPSQAQAEEKFKLCVNAYKSLCSALAAA